MWTVGRITNCPWGGRRLIHPRGPTGLMLVLGWKMKSCTPCELRVLVQVSPSDLFVHQSGLGRMQGTKMVRDVVICFTICLRISLDLDGYRALKIEH